MQRRSYGEYLREAREQKGIDMVSMARALHIRADIVGAIEEANFAKLPAHGYCKNMVRAYAQKVGLNENELCEMYLAEREVYDGVSYSHSTSLPSRPIADTSSRRLSYTEKDSQSRHTARSRATSQHSQQVEGRTVSRSVRSRSLDERRSQPLPSRSVSLNDARPLQSSSSYFAGLVSSFLHKNKNATPTMQSSFTQGGSLTGFSGSRNAARRNTSSGSSFQLGGFSLPALNVPLVGIGALVVVILVVVVVVFSNGGQQAKNELPSIPISGLTDTSAANQSESAKLAAAPSSAVFTFNVAEGKKAWIAVYQDGAETPVYAAVATGPLSKNFDVTGTLKFETANIAAVTLTVDGDEVQATPSGKGTNYTYTVDFPSILNAWKKAHDISDAASGSSGQSSAPSAATSSNTSSQTSGSVKSSTGSKKS